MKDDGCPTSSLIVTVPNDGLGADIVGTIRGFEGFSYRGSMIEKLSELRASRLATDFKLAFHKFDIPFGRSKELSELAHNTLNDSDWTKGAPFAIEPDHEISLDSPIGQNFNPGGRHNDYLDRFAVPYAHGTGYFGDNRKVTIIDTGYDGALAIAGGWDVAHSPASPAAKGDLNGHGTAMLTLAQSIAPHSEFSFIRVADNEAITIWSLISALFVASQDADADIISMSLGFEHIHACPFCGGSAATRSFALECMAALVAATPNSQGREPIMLASTGNAGRSDGIKRPAVFDDVVAIGSVGVDGKHSNFSNYDRNGSKTYQFSAFGGQTDSTGAVVEHCGAGDTAPCFGTSPATAYSAGLLALLWSGLGNIDRATLLNEIKKNHVLKTGPVTTHGSGLLCVDPGASTLAVRRTVLAGRRRIRIP